MESRYLLRVGLLIAVATAIAMFAIFEIGRGARLLIGTQTFVLHFHRTNGLQAGAPVSLSGVDIGGVESIQFPKDLSADYVVVKIWVKGSAAPRLHVNSTAYIDTMGLLGDKFVELTPGTPGAPVAAPGMLLPSEDPIDYLALLRRPGAGDFVANVVSVTNSLRVILEKIEKGQGVMGELVQGPPKGKSVSLAQVADTLDHINRLLSELDETARNLNHGRGLAAAMLSNKTNGRKIMADLAASVASLKETTARVDALTARLEKARGTLPQLIEDRQYADTVLAQLRESSRDLHEILEKINSGQGTIGGLVNDPSVYYGAKGLVSGGGWGWSLLHGLYSLTHPFSTTEAASQPAMPVGANGQPEQPASLPASAAVAPAAAPQSNGSSDGAAAH